MSEIQALVDLARNHPLALDLARQGLGFVARTAVDALKARVAKPDGGAEKVAREIARLTETLEEFREDVASRSSVGSWNIRTAEREAQEPSTESFIERAANLSIDARVESKRRLIGRLISRRLQIDDSDEDEAAATTALEIVGACTERQLLAIAAIHLTKNLGAPEPALANLDEVEAWLSAQHGTKVRAIVAGPEWDDRQLEGLGRAGAITMPLHRSGAFLGHANHGDDIDQWLLLHDFSMLEFGGGQPERERFPITTTLHSISRGYHAAKNGNSVPYRLDELHLTRAGNLLGEEILETLSRQGSSTS